MTAPVTAVVTGTFPAQVSANPVFVPSCPVSFGGAPELLPGAPVQARISGGALTALDGSPLALPVTSAGSPIGPTGFWFWTCKGLPGLPDFGFFLTGDADLSALIQSGLPGSGTGVQSVNGQAGTVVLAAADVGAVSAGDVSAAVAAEASRAEAAEAGLVPSSVLGAEGGVATLDSGGQVPAAQLGNVPTGLQLVETTGTAGITLSAAGQQLSWTAPGDGKLHRFMIYTAVHISSAANPNVDVTAHSQMPDGTNGNTPLILNSAGPGEFTQAVGGLMNSGSTVSVWLQNALTSGAATLWAEIWGS